MNQLVVLMLIGVAGAMGALARYGTLIGMNKVFGEGFPLGTLTVNVVGCFLLGMLASFTDQHISQHWKLIAGVGFLGALTTFSTFGLETVTRFNAGQTLIAFSNIGLNVVLGMAAVILGMFVVESFSPPE